jgi:hypothetical protein
MGPPQAVKEKHVRLRVAPAALETSASGGQGAGGTPALPWRSKVTFKAMGWGLKESCDKLQLLAGDRLDIAYTLGLNDHPEFGGLELTLRDLRRSG